MECSVLLAQIRREEGGGLAAPCPGQRWMEARSGHRVAGSRFGAAAGAGSAVHAEP